MLQLSNDLLRLPLFLGIGSSELSEIVGNTKFGFHKLLAGQLLAAEGDRCTQLFFLMAGSLSVESHADNHRYSIVEELSAPAVIQPEHLFGLMSRYSRTFSAQTDCSLLALSKEEILRLLDSYLICRLNFLNILSMQAQRQGRTPWRQNPTDIRQQFFAFLRLRCITQAGRKVLKIKMETLGHELHQSRLNVSHMLNQLQEEGLISITRGLITIPQLELLR